VSIASSRVVLEVAGLLQGESPATKISEDVMTRLVKIMKRAERQATYDTEISSARTTGQSTTEMIVRSWIIESRERRDADVCQFQTIRRKIGGTMRG
jgi:hypothetical protein